MMGEPFTWDLNHKPEPPEWGGWGANRWQDRVPGSAPLLPSEDQLLREGEEGQDPAREGTGKPFLQCQPRAPSASVSFSLSA